MPSRRLASGCHNPVAPLPEGFGPPAVGRRSGPRARRPAGPLPRPPRHRSTPHAVLHLENVLTELHAVTIREGLAFPDHFTTWQDGRPLSPEAPGYAKTLLDQPAR